MYDCRIKEHIELNKPIIGQCLYQQKQFEIGVIKEECEKIFKHITGINVYDNCCDNEFDKEMLDDYIKNNNFIKDTISYDILMRYYMCGFT